MTLRPDCADAVPPNRSSVTSNLAATMRVFGDRFIAITPDTGLPEFYFSAGQLQERFPLFGRKPARQPASTLLIDSATIDAAIQNKARKVRQKMYFLRGTIGFIISILTLP